MILENFRLKVFRVVAEHSSFRKAGEALYLTQPAVTLQIKAPEEELGTILFGRGHRGSERAVGNVLFEERLRHYSHAYECEKHGASVQS